MRSKTHWPNANQIVMISELLLSYWNNCAWKGVIDCVRVYQFSIWNRMHNQNDGKWIIQSETPATQNWDKIGFVRKKARVRDDTREVSNKVLFLLFFSFFSFVFISVRKTFSIFICVLLCALVRISHDKYDKKFIDNLFTVKRIKEWWHLKMCAASNEIKVAGNKI